MPVAGRATNARAAPGQVAHASIDTAGIVTRTIAAAAAADHSTARYRPIHNSRISSGPIVGFVANTMPRTTPASASCARVSIQRAATTAANSRTYACAVRTFASTAGLTSAAAVHSGRSGVPRAIWLVSQSTAATTAATDSASQTDRAVIGDSQTKGTARSAAAGVLGV